MFPSSEVPVRTIVQIISILDKYLLLLLYGVYAGQAGDHPPPRVVKHHKLSVGDKTVVGLVGQGCAVVFNVAIFGRNVYGTIWFS